MNNTLDSKEERIMRELLRMCHDVPAVSKARLAAAVTVRGEVLAWGMNELRSHPFASRWGKNSDAIYWHAETKAIHNFIRRHDVNLLQKATVMVTRIKRPFERSKEYVPGMARPCKGCFSCIRDFGIQRIAYTDESGAFVCEVAQTV